MSTSKTVARSYLFVPGDRPERFDKAMAAGADVVIVDLEDAVDPGNKEAARAHLRAWLDVRHPVCVRINAAGSSWFAGDLALCSHPGVAGIVLPKARWDCGTRWRYAARPTWRGWCLAPSISVSMQAWSKATRVCCMRARSWCWCRAWPGSWRQSMA
jgi:hypothetical protein